MTAIVYYPAFEETEHLQQQIARACWYLSPIAPSSVRMQSSLEPDRFVPEGYTPEVERFASELPEWLSVRPDPVTLRDLEKADIVLLWKGTSALDALGSGIPQKLRKKGIMVFDVDHTDRMEGSRYIDISHRHPRNDAEIIANSKARFDELTREVAHLNDAYLFCSGPEVSRYTNFRYADGINIICNSVINDAELLAAAPPHVQIFGDPIFHFGCSQYAHEFRQKLTETHEQYGYRCIVPMKYFNLFTFWQPELAASTMAVPFDVKLDINLDLEANFLLHTTDNILTFLMLPVGCTLANNVYLLGCDGRPLNQNDYFWKHNEKTQFVGQMNNIQEVHPSFFKLDYDEYYLRHCDNVQAYVETGERAGKHFQMLTPSHIPALRAREHPFARADATQKLTVGLEPNAGNSQLTDALSEYGQASNTVVLGNTTADGRVAQPVFADGGSDEEMQWVADQMQRWIGPVAIRSNGIAPDNVDAVQRIFSPLSEDIQLKTMAPTVTSKQKTREPGQSSLSLQQSFDLADLAYDLAKHRLDVQNEERKVKSLTQLVGDQSQALSALGSKHEALLEEHRALLDGHRALLQELTATKKSLSEFRGQLSDIKNTHSTENALQQERTKNLKLEQKLDHTRLSDRVRILGERQAKVEEQQKAVQPAARHFAAMERFQSNEPDYQRFTRHLQKAELEQFSEEAKSVYGLDLTPRAIAYLAHRIRQVESKCLGRLATSIHAALSRAIALMSLKDKHLNYVEIGVLFGINSAIVWDLLRYAFESATITCIDPLEGYYDADALDTLVGLPINETVLRQNLAHAMCDMEQVTILKGLSEDPEIISKASKRSYNYLLIDGDHSYDGVRRDFENYAPMVSSGGIVAVDDYGADEWPEVTAYCDRVLMEHPGYEVLSKTHRTLILRKS